jgi:hypothetical protein
MSRPSTNALTKSADVRFHPHKSTVGTTARMPMMLVQSCTRGGFCKNPSALGIFNSDKKYSLSSLRGLWH